MSQDFVPMGSGMQPKTTNVWVIVGIVAGVIVLVTCCCVAIALIMSFSGPMIFGPAVGNIFENVVEGLE